MLKLDRETYRLIIAENLRWLEAQPRTLERDHVIEIVKASEDHEYGRIDGTPPRVDRARKPSEPPGRSER